MKILIVGEMSGAAKELAKGFKKNGCTLNHIGFGNLFRNISPEVNLSEYKGVYGYIDRFFKIYQIFFRQKYDLIIFIRYWKFSEFRMLNQILFSRLREKTNLLIFWSLSCDKIVRDTFKITSPLCEPCLISDKRCICKYEESKFIDQELTFKSYIDIIATGSIEYKEAYDAANISNVFIPLGIFIDDSNNTNFKLSNNHIKIYHSMSNIAYKGSDVFLKAISNKKFDNKFQFQVEEKLPLEKHILNIKNSDVIFDQLYNRSLGMNSLHILKNGKILLCGKLNPEFGDFKLPFITSRDEEGVLASLNELKDNFNLYKDALLYNYEILKKNHNTTKIASDFLNLI